MFERFWRCNKWLAPAALTLAAAAGEARSRGLEGRSECTVTKGTDTTLGETIALEPGPAVPPRLVEAAIELWAACANYGTGFPRLVRSDSGSRVIRVERAAAPVGTRCGAFAASTIQIHGIARDGARAVPCAAPERILAHEIGHALGLADAPPVPWCRDHIMAQAFAVHDSGRRVQPAECQAVGQRWLTVEEHELQRRLVTDWTGEPSTEERP
jgi:hypothetical protein